ncbi:MAG: universal stress protein [OCS116 cluster bacterium]|uniref:Universal stress protein UspA n=1 Tax=OCS116 cluster bacterium TaxID=2030921 RepID=A0A2A4Z4Z4_9PROT|nr:universal stress protein [OCS116 cluster bacterium]
MDCKRKFLVVIDDTDECRIALKYAASRAIATGALITILHVIDNADFQHWLGVEAIMRDEAYANAEQVIKAILDDVESAVELMPEIVVKQGDKREEILDLIKQDEAIAILMLGSAVDGSGPGPLVASLANQSAEVFPIPVTLIPGNLSDKDISALS